MDHVSSQPSYFIGQRVILNEKEIGTVVVSETGRTSFGIWVFSPSKGYASDYAMTSVRPLPNGQL
jgi:hypothetical protein